MVHGSVPEEIARREALEVRLRARDGASGESEAVVNAMGRTGG